MNKDNGKKLEQLPNAELDVIQVLWKATEPMNTTNILEIMNQEKCWAMSTLQALLSRLEKRGFIKSQMHRHIKYYVSVIGRDGYRLNETKTFLKKLYDNSFKSMVAALLDNKAIDEKDIDEIAEMLRRAGEKNA